MLATIIVILDCNQVMRTTLQLLPPFPKYQPQQWVDFESRKIEHVSDPLHSGSSGALGLGLMTRRPRVRDHDHKASVAFQFIEKTKV
ncbi:hypothetical protein TNCV_1788941 [Trichonephila clavipes]|nr:hypothetical protein TNCV_1788941 [Trichonephila clavipes]